MEKQHFCFQGTEISGAGVCFMDLPVTFGNRDDEYNLYWV